MNLSDKEIALKKEKYTIIAFSIIGTIILFAIICIFSVKLLFNATSMKKYYVLNVTNKNKNEVIKLFNQEKENIFYTKNYCDSIYKIEYYNGFPDGTNYVMYCKDENNIEFSIDKVGKDTLKAYIYDNGYIEKR